MTAFTCSLSGMQAESSSHGFETLPPNISFQGAEKRVVQRGAARRAASLAAGLA